MGEKLLKLFMCIFPGQVSCHQVLKGAVMFKNGEALRDIRNGAGLQLGKVRRA